VQLAAQDLCEPMMSKLYLKPVILELTYPQTSELIRSSTENLLGT